MSGPAVEEMRHGSQQNLRDRISANSRTSASPTLTALQKYQKQENESDSRSISDAMALKWWPRNWKLETVAPLETVLPDSTAGWIHLIQCQAGMR